MVSFMQATFLGARVWIWLMLLASIIMILVIVAIVNREKIHEKWLKWRHPEKVVKIVVHYPSNMFKIYWRKIPTSDTIMLADAKYNFNRKKLLKEEHVKNEDEMQFLLNGKKYNYDKDRRIRHKHATWPEIHYKDNCIMPLDFTDIKEGNIGVSSAEFKQLQENDLWLQLLTMKDVLQQWGIMMIILIANVLISLFTLAKIMGWLDKK